MSNVVELPTRKCIECGARATRSLELFDVDSGVPAVPKLYCDAHFPVPLNEDGLRLLVDKRDAEIGRLRDVLRQIKLKALSGCESNALGRIAHDALNN